MAHLILRIFLVCIFNVIPLSQNPMATERQLITQTCIDRGLLVSSLWFLI